MPQILGGFATRVGDTSNLLNFYFCNLNTALNNYQFMKKNNMKIE